MKKVNIATITAGLGILSSSRILKRPRKKAESSGSIFLACLLTIFIGSGGNIVKLAFADSNNAGASFKIWPDTGQNKCYDNDGDITCPTEGEPFYGQDAQYQGPQRSYTKLGVNGIELSDSATPADGWIMTRDNVTGLIWEIKTDDGGIHDKDNKYTWCNTNSATNGGNEGTCGDGTDTEDFINDLNDNNFGGYSDWRLPTIKELSTLMNTGVPSPGPTIDAAYFPQTISSSYWSSTATAGNIYTVLHVDFNYGYVSEYSKDGNFYVRAVRGGELYSPSFVDNHNGTITDLTTGLMWQKCSMGQTYNASTNGCDGSATRYNWQQSLAECESLELAGHKDWRLPNRNELQSIVDYSRNNPGINTDYFPQTMSSCYWSSTTDAYYMNNAWCVNFHYNYVDDGDKDNTIYVRAVRSAQDFDDVPLDFWAYTYISKLYASGITSGCGNGNFCPNQPVTRAQMAVFLERGIHGSNYNPPAATGIFNDVSTSYWAADWIEQLYSDSITSGCGNGNFCPNQLVTRAQMAVFLLRAKHGSNYNPPAASGIFNDVSTSYWAADWIEQLYSEGITSGCGNNNFCPNQPVTRAQMAVFLVRTFGL